MVNGIIVKTMILQKKVDFHVSSTGSMPIYFEEKESSVFELNTYKHYLSQVELQKNDVWLENSFIQFGQRDNHTYVDFKDAKTVEVPQTSANTNVLFNQQIFLSPIGVMHIRKTLSLMDLLSFIGGALLSVFIIIAIIIQPCQRYAFKMRAIKRMYLARTNDPLMFPLKVNQLQEEESYQLDDSEVSKEIQTHRKIRVKNEHWCTLFFGLNDNYGLEQMYSQGNEKLEDELNIVNIVQKLRQLEVIMENSFLKTQERKMLVNHTYQNILD